MFGGQLLNCHHGNNDDVYNNLSDDDDELSSLGQCIGMNTNLITLEVQINRTKGEPKVVDRFYDGLKRNSSIKCLTFHCSGLNLVGGVLHKILNAYQANSSRLTALHIDNADLQNGGDNIINTTLRRCTNLKEIKLTYCSITDPQCTSLIRLCQLYLYLLILVPRARAEKKEGQCLEMQITLCCSALSF